MDNISNKINNELIDYFNKNKITSDYQKSKIVRELFDSIALNFGNQSNFNSICAPNVVVEIIDKSSGQLFRRYVEVEYNETTNGLQLIGETLDAKPTSIVFLSEKYIEKLQELNGHGEDESNCDSHT